MGPIILFSINSPTPSFVSDGHVARGVHSLHRPRRATSAASPSVAARAPTRNPPLSSLAPPRRAPPAPPTSPVPRGARPCCCCSVHFRKLHSSKPGECPEGAACSPAPPAAGAACSPAPPAAMQKGQPLSSLAPHFPDPPAPSPTAGLGKKTKVCAAWKPPPAGPRWFSPPQSFYYFF